MVKNVRMISDVDLVCALQSVFAQLEKLGVKRADTFPINRRPAPRFPRRLSNAERMAIRAELRRDLIASIELLDRDKSES